MNLIFMTVAFGLSSAVAAWYRDQFRRWDIEPSPVVVLASVLALVAGIIALVLTAAS